MDGVVKDATERGTLTVGCLVMILVAVWRLGKLLAREVAEKTDPQEQLWGRWTADPEPLRGLELLIFSRLEL